MSSLQKRFYIFHEFCWFFQTDWEMARQNRNDWNIKAKRTVEDTEIIIEPYFTLCIVRISEIKRPSSLQIGASHLDLHKKIVIKNQSISCYIKNCIAFCLSFQEVIDFSR